MSQRRALAALVLFALLTVVHTWPLASAPATLSRNDNADTVLNEWAIAWVAHQLPRDPLRLFQANIFHPERNALAFSEHMVVQGVLGIPLFAAGASPVLAYNLLVLAGFTLTAWGMFLVMYRWTGDVVAALAAGSLAAFNAHTFTRIPHLQALHVEFLPLAVFALDRVLVTRKISWGVALGCCFSLQALTSNYWMVFITFAIVAAFASRPDGWWGRRFPLTAICAAAVIVMAAVIPFLVPYYQVSRDLGLLRSLQDVAWYSGSWRDYFSTPVRLHFNLWSHEVWAGGGKTPLFPGVLPTLLAAFGGLALVRDGRARMWLAITVAGFLLSLGTALPGYATLYEIFPLLKGIRAPIRAGHLMLIGIGALAGFGVWHARQRWPLLRHVAVTAALLLVITAETFVAPLGLQPAAPPDDLYAALAGERRAIVAEIPFAPPRSPQLNAAYMLGSTRHWRPLLNGYSGFVPGSYVRHFEGVRGFPDGAALAYLKAQGVTHVIVHDLDVRSAGAALTPVASNGTMVIYRLRWDRIDSGR